MSALRAAFTITLFALTSVAGQQPNTPLAALAVNGDPLASLGMGPLALDTFTDSPLDLRIVGQPDAPLIAGGGTLAVGTLFPFNSSLDLAPAVGGWGNNVFLDGFRNPSIRTDLAGNFTFSTVVPSCTATATGAAGCSLPSNWTFAVQGLTTDPTNAPFGVRLTAACEIAFTNGHVELSLGDDGFAAVGLLGGMTLPFYGQPFTQIFVSANGFISFTPPQPAPATPTVVGIRNGPPCIMAFFTELDPTITTSNPRIYTEQFIDGGERRLLVAWDSISASPGIPGPFTAVCEMTESGTIAIFSPAGTPCPSTNLAVGITPGLGIDSGFPPAFGQTFFGRDLSADALGGPTSLGSLRGGFELFDHGIVPSFNRYDLDGLNPPIGVRFEPDPQLSAGDGYRITL